MHIKLLWIQVWDVCISNSYSNDLGAHLNRYSQWLALCTVMPLKMELVQNIGQAAAPSAPAFLPAPLTGQDHQFVYDEYVRTCTDVCLPILWSTVVISLAIILNTIINYKNKVLLLCGEWQMYFVISLTLYSSSNLLRISISISICIHPLSMCSKVTIFFSILHDLGYQRGGCPCPGPSESVVIYETFYIRWH